MASMVQEQDMIEKLLRLRTRMEINLEKMRRLQRSSIRMLEH